MDNLNFRKTRDIGDILTESFFYIRNHFVSLGKALLFFVLPIFLIQFFVMKDFANSFFANIMSGNPDALGSIFDWRYFLGLLLSVISSAALGVVTLTHVKLNAEGDTAEPDQILVDFGPRLIKFIGLTIAIGFILGFSVLLLFIPAIFLGVKLGMSAPALILEDENVFGAMGRSWELTKDYWWATFTMIFMVYILVLVITYAFLIPVFILQIFGTDSGAALSGNPAIISNIFMVITGLFTAISSLSSGLFYIAFSLHFYNLVERKEGGDLREKIEGLFD
jgi:membrane-anchored glycerophosphoryl diester phosphodiesterase (GDPDase)